MADNVRHSSCVWATNVACGLNRERRGAEKKQPNGQCIVVREGNREFQGRVFDVEINEFSSIGTGEEKVGWQVNPSFDFVLRAFCANLLNSLPAASNRCFKPSPTAPHAGLPD